PCATMQDQDCSLRLLILQVALQSCEPGKAEKRYRRLPADRSLLCHVTSLGEAELCLLDQLLFEAKFPLFVQCLNNQPMITGGIGEIKTFCQIFFCRSPVSTLVCQYSTLL